MLIFPDGILITTVEESCLLHMVPTPEQWLLATVVEKARLRRDALIAEWRPRLFADASVTELPADAEALCALIMARSDYKTRLQQDAAQTPAVVAVTHNAEQYAAMDRTGPTVTLFPSGIDLTDVDVNCIMAYVQDLSDWVIGALLGQINRGKKLIIREWQPVILDDPDVSIMPATEDGLINMIVARSDYQRLGG